MKWFALLALLLPVFVQAEDCAWNPVLLTDEGFTDQPVYIQNNRCVDVDPLTVFWLDSDGCECVFDGRFIGDWQSCDGLDPGECSFYSWGYSIAGVSTGGAVVGDQWSGVASPDYPPPTLYWDQATKVGCGDLLGIDVDITCECHAFDSDEVQSVETDAHGAVTYVVTTAVRSRPVCEAPSNEPLLRVVARCDMECDPTNPPDPILIEAAPQ